MMKRFLQPMPSVRYGFNWSSNSFIEIQWYLFAYMVMVDAKDLQQSALIV